MQNSALIKGALLFSLDFILRSIDVFDFSLKCHIFHFNEWAEILSLSQ